MAQHPRFRKLARRLQGITLLVVLAALVALSVLIYQKVFTPTVNVTLQAQRIGLQLIVPADVKVRGILVGEVRGVADHGDRATLSLALQPSQVGQIPENVEARILPKTLFGEKFVDLVIPQHPAATHLKSGDVIAEDRSATAIEVDKVFNDLVPTLRALHPVQLSTWLTNMSDALRGQGDALGANLVNGDRYLQQFNKHLPTLTQDISAFADMMQTYADAAPNLLQTLRNFSVNARTMVQKQGVFADLLQSTQSFASVATNVLTENENGLIRLAAVNRPTLETLARYSPEFPCLLSGIDRIGPLLDQTFRPANGSKPELHIVLQVINQPNGYQWSADQPKYDQDIGPNCHGLPVEPRNTTFSPNGDAVTSSMLGIGPVGSAGEVSTISMITAPLVGQPSDSIDGSLADLMTGPILRGMQVSLS